MNTRYWIPALSVVLLALSGGSASGQTDWIKYEANPVITAPGLWYQGAFSPCVLYNSDSSRFEMWFSGSAGAKGDRPCRVGYAVSADGMSWTVRSTPVLSPDSGRWDSYTVDAPYVIRENGQYKMWYTGTTDFLTFRIGYATSTDGIEWTKHPVNPVFGADPESWELVGAGFCCVMPSEGKYKMWYTSGQSNLAKDYIGYAESADGVQWQRDTLNNPVLGPGGTGQWDAWWTALPRVLKIDDLYYMWYVGANASGSGLRGGLATSRDGITNWVKYEGNPVLRPSSPGGWDGVEVETGTVMLVGDSLYLYYDGYGTRFRIGLAKCLFIPEGMLVDRIDHVSCSYNTIEEVDSISGIFSGLLGLPQWFPPAVRSFVSPAGQSNYGTGVYLGNMFLEFITYDTTYPGVQAKTYSPYSHGLAFVNDISNTLDELGRRGVSRSGEYHFSFRNLDQTIDTLFTNITVDGLVSSRFLTFFCEYHPELFDCDAFGFPDLPPMVNPDDQHLYYQDLLEQSGGGPLGVKGVESVTLTTGSQAFEGDRSILNAIYQPTIESDTGKWRGPRGPELVLQSAAQTLRLKAITVTVEALSVARDYLLANGVVCGEPELDEDGRPYAKVGLGAAIGADLILKQEDPTSVTVSESLPERYTLEQNYPNPFNPSTTIRYALPQSSYVTLSVFNLLGQQVATLVEGEMEAGHHEVKFDASGLASGVYLYRLKAGDCVQVRRLLLLR